MNFYQNKTDLIQEAIKYLGSPTRFAEEMNVSKECVVDWQKGKKVPNPMSALRIENITNGIVKASDIRPDYPWGKSNQCT